MSLTYHDSVTGYITVWFSCLQLFILTQTIKKKHLVWAIASRQVGPISSSGPMCYRLQAQYSNHNHTDKVKNDKTTFGLLTVSQGPSNYDSCGKDRHFSSPLLLLCWSGEVYFSQLGETQAHHHVNPGFSAFRCPVLPIEAVENRGVWIKHWGEKLELVYFSCCRTVQLQIPAIRFSHSDLIITLFHALNTGKRLCDLVKSLLILFSHDL